MHSVRTFGPARHCHSRVQVRYELLLEDAALPCLHVNYLEPLSHIRKESEMLFPPYSLFQVVSVEADQFCGSATNPIKYVLITLRVAVDNQSQPDELPLAPWS